MNTNSSIPAMAAGKRNAAVVPKRQLNCPFYPLVKEELLWLRSQKLINNTAFVYMALRLENPHCDRPIQIQTKRFALIWGIPESSLYEALAKLRSFSVLKFINKTVTIQWKQNFDIWQIATESEEADSQQDNVSGNPESIMRSQRVLRKPRKNSETSENYKLKPFSSKNSKVSHTIQTSTDSPESVEEDILLKETPPAPLGASAIVPQDVEEERLPVAAPQEVSANAPGGNTDQPETVGTTLDSGQDTFSAAASLPEKSELQIGHQADRDRGRGVALDFGQDHSSATAALPQKTALLIKGDSDRPQLVQTICQQISDRHCYWVTQVQREQMMQLTASQLEKVVETFQQFMEKRSAYTKSLRFDHALRVGRYSPS